MDPRLQIMASVLVEHSARIQPGDRVLLEATTAAQPLIRALFQEVLEHGGHPYPLLKFPDQDLARFQFSQEHQLDHENQLRKFAYENFESRIRIHSLTDTSLLREISPKKQSVYQKAQSGILETQLKRGAVDALKWVSTLYPTRAYAEQAGMSLSEFEDFVFAACKVDQPDPVEKWNQVRIDQEAALSLFEGGDLVSLSGPNIDLELSVKNRKFLNSHGVHNMPDGEIFTGPVENSVNGWVRFTFPAIHRGVVVRGIELTFQDGKVVKASAEEQEEYLLQLLDTDEGSRTLGEFAMGMNPQIQQFTGNILFDEKIGGTIHMAVGAGYPETGSQNKSALHWDMICDMRTESTIAIDGKTIFEDGHFST